MYKFNEIQLKLTFVADDKYYLTLFTKARIRYSNHFNKIRWQLSDGVAVKICHNIHLLVREVSLQNMSFCYLFGMCETIESDARNKTL